MEKDKAYTICPDDNVLAQFIEGTLAEKDEDLVLLHLDQCPTCYSIVRAALESELEEAMSEEEQCDPGEDAVEILNYHAAGNNNGGQQHTHASNCKYCRKDYTCAIKVQQLVLAEFDIKISEKELLEEASQEGWYTEGKGMLLEHVGKTLNKHGIKTERIINAALQELERACYSGSQVIVAVDSGEIWFSSDDEQERERQEDLIEEIPDHVVLVVGLEKKNEIVTGISIKDPVVFEGIKTIAVDVFMNAWQDSDFFMIKTLR
nr:hypothetical protein [uncultured Draconibacterium sp.]